jgi:hypothetical protein
MAENYDQVRKEFSDIVFNKATLLNGEENHVIDDLMIRMEDLMWDGVARWAKKAFKNNWVQKGEWKDEEDLTSSIVTHILTYWNEEMTADIDIPTLLQRL